MKTLNCFIVFSLAATPILPAQGLLMDAGNSYGTHISQTHDYYASGFGTTAFFHVNAEGFDNNDTVRFQMRLGPSDPFEIDTYLNPASPVVGRTPGGFWGLQNEVILTVVNGSILLRGVSYEEMWDMYDGRVHITYGDVIVIPEPSSVALLALGLGGFGVLLRRRRPALGEPLR